MTGRRTAVVSVLALLTATSPLAAEKWDPDYEPPRMPDGRPSLEGNWSFASITRLERPREVLVLHLDEAGARQFAEKAFEWQAEQAADFDLEKPPELGGELSGSEDETFDFGTNMPAIVDGTYRSSWIVEPEDGQLPIRAWIRDEFRLAGRIGDLDFGNPESRFASERCVAETAVPILNYAPYGNITQVVQTPEVLAFHQELFHLVRLVHVGGTHQSAEVQSWNGSSVGTWEGDTLVVESRFGSPKYANRGDLIIGPDALVKERFTRVSPTEIFYEFTVEDPGIYTRPWRAEMVLTRTDGKIYEFACHEGNYSLPGILAGARQEEKVLRDAAAQPGRGARD